MGGRKYNVVSGLGADVLARAMQGNIGCGAVYLGSKAITGERRRQMVAVLKARDGNLCWLCFRAIRKGQETIEHLLARSLGGTYALDNLALCHPGCNRHLANRAVDDKWKMRRRRRKKILAARENANGAASGSRVPCCQT